MSGPAVSSPTPAPPASPPSRASGGGRVRRVLMISSLYRGGGAARAARELHEQFRARGIEVRMLVASRRPDDPPEVTAARFRFERYLRPVEWLAGGDVDWRHLGSKWRLGRLRDDEFDVVHMHNLHDGWMSLRSIAALCRRVPSVWTFHDEYPVIPGLGYDLTRVMTPAQIVEAYPDVARHVDSTHPWARRRARKFERWLPRPGAIVCPSQYLADLAARTPRYAGVPVLRIPYGLSMLALPERDAPRDAARRRFDLDPDPRSKVVLLIAAHLGSAYKGMDLAVKLLRQLADSRPQLLIIGPGGAELAAKVGGTGKVVCPGWIDDDALLARAYRAADVTLVPSRADNFPYVALESLACATPLVAFRVGGLAEMIGEQDERGVSAEPFDVDALAAKTRDLLADDPRRRAAGDAGRAWVEQRCDMRQYVESTLDAYQRVTQRSPAATTGPANGRED